MGDEGPAAQADRAGSAYADAVPRAERRRRGLYLTPVPVAAFMAGLLDPEGPDGLDGRGAARILDPAAGAGVLLCAAVEHLVQRARPPRRIELHAYEADAALAAVLAGCLEGAAAWARRRGVSIEARVTCGDFLAHNGRALEHEGDAGEAARFDAVIANPPYFKIGRGDPRAVAAAAVVHGQPNIYGLFLAVGAALLRRGGRLVYLTPRSFASGPYFEALRRRLFAALRPTRVHLFGSRREAFGRDAVLQENLILAGVREPGWDAGAAEVILSHSRGAADLPGAQRRVPAGELLRGPGRLLRLPLCEEDAAAVRRVESWPGTLAAHGLAVSTGPVVAFRAAAHLAAAPGPGDAPLLWLSHVRPMEVRFPLGGRREHLRPGAPAWLRLPDRGYVILRRFSAKEERRRLVAAPLLRGQLGGAGLGLENHLNYVHRPGGSLGREEAFGLAALYNSALVDRYFRTASGNTQASAAELRALPLPPWEAILALGRRAAAAPAPALAELDALVEEMAPLL